MAKMFKSFTAIITLLVALIYAPASFAELTVSNYNLTYKFMKKDGVSEFRSDPISGDILLEVTTYDNLQKLNIRLVPEDGEETTQTLLQSNYKVGNINTWIAELDLPDGSFFIQFTSVFLQPTLLGLKNSMRD